MLPNKGVRIHSKVSKIARIMIEHLPCSKLFAKHLSRFRHCVDAALLFPRRQRLFSTWYRWSGAASLSPIIHRIQ